MQLYYAFKVMKTVYDYCNDDDFHIVECRLQDQDPLDPKAGFRGIFNRVTSVFQV